MQSQLLKEEFQKNSIGNAIYSMIKDFLEIERDVFKNSIRKAIDVWEALNDKSIVEICEQGLSGRIETMKELFLLIEKEYLDSNQITDEKSVHEKFTKALSNYIIMDSHPMTNCKSIICSPCN